MSTTWTTTQSRGGYEANSCIPMIIEGSAELRPFDG